MASLPMRAKGPQPVLDSLIRPEDNETSEARPSPYFDAPRSTGLREPTVVARSSTFMFHNEAEDTDQEQTPTAAFNRPKLLRAKTDVGPRRDSSKNEHEDSDMASTEIEWGLRHGFDTQLGSEEYNNLLTSNFFLYYTDKKHESGGNPKERRPPPAVQEWRMRDRLKTVSAVLALCLNIGVDPPDVIKTSPCAKEECWIDPATVQNTSSGNAPLTAIGKALQAQYEQLSLRTRYKLALDPTVEETKKYATGLRKNARSERVLFHYNGHGVPKPTTSGEVWVFNKNYTQYIPISLYDLQTWVSGPSLFVWDCSEAGVIIQNFLKFAEKHQAQNAEVLRRDPNADIVDCSDYIHLAACSEKESLPTNPNLPADIFTACLTTPIKMAVRFHILQDPLSCSVSLQEALNIPGTVSERRTPLGELNWIFTAITDTIAWDALPKSLFKKLFRQDLMVAALYRNFLLAQRIMKKYHCHPQCYPIIPDLSDHPLWQSWDLAVETMLFQLPDLLAAQRGEKVYEYQHSTFFAEQLTAFEMYLSQDAGDHKIPEQLPVVLQVLLSQVHRLRALILLSKFLDLGPWAVDLALGIGIFPYVLKLLQSQAMELKPVMVFIWARILAVDKSCQTDLVKENGYQYFIQILNPAGVGIVSHLNFPLNLCNLKRVKNSNPEFMTFPMDMDSSKQRMSSLGGLIRTHLLDENIASKLMGTFASRHLGGLSPWTIFRFVEMEDHDGYGDDEQPFFRMPLSFQECCKMFHEFLKANNNNTGIQGVVNVSEHRAMCAFIIAMFCKDFHQGQSVCLSEELIESCLSYFGDMQNPLLRQWSCLCLSMLFHSYPEAKWLGIKCGAHQRLCDLVVDCVAEVRAAMLHALTNFLGIPGLTPQVAHIEESIASMVLIMASDGNSMVRKELLVFFSHFVIRYQYRFHVAAYELLLEEKNTLAKSRDDDSSINGKGAGQLDQEDSISSNTVFSAVLKQILILSVDPHPEISEKACALTDYIFSRLLLSPLGQYAHPLVDLLLLQRTSAFSSRSSYVEVPHPQPGRPPTPPTPTKGEGYFSASLKRTASVAASLKNLAFGSSTNLVDMATGRAPVTRPGPDNSRPSSQADQNRGSFSQVLKEPLPSGFKAIPEDRIAIPLESKFFDWSVEYFREPQMQPPEAEEPGSVDYNHRLWRRNRNDKIIAKTQPLKEMAGSSPWDKPKGFWNNGTQPMKLCWHQFEEHLIVTDDKDGVSIWDWKRQVRLNRFSNGNPPRSRITEVRLINEDDQGLLMTGSSDGIIKLFKNYESTENVEMVTAFRALTDLERSNKSAGLVFDWQQSSGHILVAGDVRSIRVWNAGTEICTSDINARSGSPITTLTSDQVEGNLLIAGFGDGALRLYDLRQKPQSALVRVWKEHKAWVTNVHLQRGGQRELISSCRNGEVKLWDLRSEKSIRTINTTGPREGLRTLAVHEHAPVFAAGTDGRQVKLYNVNGTLLSHFEPWSQRFMSVAAGGVSAVAFHPHRMIVAGAALGDTFVNVFACGRKGEKEI